MSVRAVLTLVRHGETEWSSSGRHTSFTDVPITGAGRRCAEGLAARLDVDGYSRVLTSPLLRARETCELAGFGDRYVIDDDLREWNYGEYEGLTTAQIRESVPGWTVFTAPVPGGESAFEVEQRADRIVAAARAAAQAGTEGAAPVSEGSTLCFGHGHFSRVVAARWLGLGAVDGRRFFLEPGGVGVLGSDRGVPVMLAWDLR